MNPRTHKLLRLVSLVVVAGSGFHALPGHAAGDATHGADVFAEECAECHSPKEPSPMQTRADTLLDLASDVIRNEVKQQIGLVTDDEITIPGTTDERILLPERPVISVAS